MNRLSSVAPAIAVALLLTFPAVTKSDESDKGKKAKTKTVEVGDIKLTVPEDWKQKPQVREPRLAEFEVPPSNGDKDSGELAVFYFGKGGAGGVDANIQRWVGQFEEDGRKVKIFSGESSQGKYTLVDLGGAYNKPIGPPIARKSKRHAGWRVLNVMLETDQGAYFIKLDGPAKTIAAVETEFRTAFGGKKETEKERKGE